MQTQAPRHAAPDTRLERNRSGYWEIRWTDRDPVTGRTRTKSHSCRTKDRRLAEDARRVFEMTAAHVSALVVDVTVDDLLDAYERDHVAANGVGATQHFALRMVRRGLGLRVVSDLSARVVSKYRSDRESGAGGARPVAPATVRRELGALRAALTWGQKRGMIDATAPLVHIDLPPQGAPRKDHMDASEEARMWDAAEALATGPDTAPRRRIGLFICLALRTAAREAAIRGLTWDRVDLQRGLIDFKDPNMATSKKRRSVVPISRDLLPVLMDARARHDGVSPYVLGHPGKVRGPWLRFCATHGFAGVRIHDLRRTWASLRVSWGVPIAEVAAVLGDTIATTEKHYAHLAPGYLRSAVDARPAGAGHEEARPN